jgi:hypothetical protein
LFQKVLKLKIETTICGIWAGYPLLGKFRLEVYGSGKLNLGMMEWGLWNHKYRIVNDDWVYGIKGLGLNKEPIYTELRLASSLPTITT